MSRLVVLDNEAVQALRDPAHSKHRRVVSHVQVVASRKRRAEAIGILVPTAVRVEAGWDRTSPAWAFPNRLRTADAPLDTQSADTAAAVRARTGVSVADAHIGAVMRARRDTQLTVITSDPGDMRLLAEDADAGVTVVAV
jgi:predicted nucleic acid-binding protein